MKKVITFNKSHKAVYSSDSYSATEARKSFLEQILSIGYVPLNIKVSAHPSKFLWIVEAATAYVGKKSARIIGEQKNEDWPPINIKKNA